MSQAKSKTAMTIQEAVEEFLESQRARLSPSTFSKYQRVMFLFRVFLDHASDHPAEEEHTSAISMQSDARILPSLAEEFKSAFLPHRVRVSSTLMSTAESVMKKFERFVEQRVDSATVREPRGKKPSREVTAAVQMHRVLAQHLTTQIPTHSARQTQDHFTVTRVEPGSLWLEPVSASGEIIGPVTVPRDVTKLCRVGWDISGVVAKSFGGWRLLEVWSVST